MRCLVQSIPFVCRVCRVFVSAFVSAPFFLACCLLLGAARLFASRLLFCFFGGGLVSSVVMRVRRSFLFKC